MSKSTRAATCSDQLQTIREILELTWGKNVLCQTVWYRLSLALWYSRHSPGYRIDSSAENYSYKALIQTFGSPKRHVPGCTRCLERMAEHCHLYFSERSKPALAQVDTYCDIPIRFQAINSILGTNFALLKEDTLKCVFILTLICSCARFYFLYTQKS